MGEPEGRAADDAVVSAREHLELLDMLGERVREVTRLRAELRWVRGNRDVCRECGGKLPLPLTEKRFCSVPCQQAFEARPRPVGPRTAIARFSIEHACSLAGCLWHVAHQETLQLSRELTKREADSIVESCQRAWAAAHGEQRGSTATVPPRWWHAHERKDRRTGRTIHATLKWAIPAKELGLPARPPNGEASQ